MKKILCALSICILAGCTTTIDGVDKDKLLKAAKLADQIEMNDYKLVATNKTLILIAPKQ